MSAVAVRAVEVLLVEDDPVTAELAGELFTEDGADFAVLHAETLADARTMLGSRTPNCIVLDLGLPDADGLEGLEHLARLAPDIPVVVLTGRDDDSFAVEAVQAGAQDYLTKADLDGTALRRAVRHAIERKRSEAELAHRALHDALTGLPNRTLFFDRLGIAVSRLARESGGVGLLFGDLDGFKAINDTAGHAAGDEALVAIARRLEGAVGASDTVARFGGDEFAIVCVGVRNARDVDVIADRLVDAVDDPQITAGDRAVGLSIGAVWTDDPDSDLDELIRLADVAMYDRKHRSGEAPAGQARAGARPSREEERRAYLRERHDAEQRLGQAEERFRGAFEDSPIGMALAGVVDGEIGPLLRVNRAMAELFEAAPLEMLAGEMASLIDPRDAELLADGVRRVAEGSEVAAELEVRRTGSDGDERCLTLSVSIVRNQPSPTVLLQVRDITERRRAETELRQSEEAKATIVASALDCVVTLDREGRVLEFNPAAEATFGYSREQVMGGDFAELMFPPRERARHRAELARIAATGESPMLNRRNDVVAMRADGSEFPMEIAVVATGGGQPTFTGFLRDLTDRRRSEEATARLAALVESSDDAILGRDLEGRITSWNPAAERLYGYAAAEVLGRRIDVLLVDPGESDRMMAALVEGRPTDVYEARRRRKDGSIIDVAISVSPVRDAAGRVVGGSAIARDITAQKRAGAALRLSELRYRTLVSQLPDSAVYEYDTDLRLLAAEGSLLAKGDLKAEDLVGRTLWELLPHDAAETFAELCRSALAGHARSFRWRSLTGADLDVDLMPLRAGDDEVTGVLVLARDVSARTRIERDLHFQAQLLDRLDVGVVATDPEGRVTHWNGQAEAYWELAREAVLGRSITELNAEFGLPDGDELMAALRGGETLQFEFPATRSDGTVLPLFATTSAVHDEDGAPVGFVGVWVDLSGPRRAADELHRAQRLFESAFENAPLGMVLVGAGGAERGSLLRVNHALCEMLGHTPDELLGRPFGDVIDREDVPRIAPMIDQLLGGRVTDFHTSVRFGDVHGGTVSAKLGVSLIRDAEGVPRHAVALIQDMTQGLRVEAERQALEERLRQSQKLDGIGRLAGGIAHDFNNLLAVILNYAQFVDERLPAESELLPDLGEIRHAAERAAALTRQLLVFGRGGVVQPQAVDLDALVADTAQMLRRTIGEDVEVQVAPVDGPWPVHADRSQMEQVVLNLALNGARRDAGRRTARHRRRERPAGRRGRRGPPRTGPGPVRPAHGRGLRVRHAARRGGAGVRALLHDEAARPGKRPRTGHGVRHRHGGRRFVDLVSEPGVGTTVEVWLPACPDEVEPPAPVVGPVPANGRGETVLVVEDDPFVRSVATRILAEGGYLVLQADGPEDAIEVAAGRDVDMLLTDVVMPGMSGNELAAALRHARPELRVLFMSGYTDDVVVRHGVRERRIAFLEKPFTRATLLQSVGDTLRGPSPPGHGAV